MYLKIGTLLLLASICSAQPKDEVCRVTNNQTTGYVLTATTTGGKGNCSWQTGGGGGAVSSVFGRTGAVVAVSGDYTVSMITGAAPLASPTFTGVPAAPTAAPGTNTTQLATTAFVLANAGGAVTSVFSRSGAVVAASGDYSVGQVTGAAPLASPTFTGVPAAPTATVGTNTTQIATTAFVLENAGSGTVACAVNGGLTCVGSSPTQLAGDPAVIAFNSAAAGGLQSGTSPVHIVSASGSGTTYTATATPTLSAYSANQTFRWNCDTTSTGASTIDIDTLGSKPLKKSDGTAIAAGTLTCPAQFTIWYDGTNFYVETVGSAGGSNTQIQFNDSGALAGNSGLTFDKTTGSVAIGTTVLTPNNAAVGDQSLINGGNLCAGNCGGVATLDVEQSFTGDPNGGGQAIVGYYEGDPTVANTTITGANLIGQSKTGNTQAIRYMDGTYNASTHQSSGVVSRASGTHSQILNFGPGEIVLAYGSYVNSAINVGGGTIDTYSSFYSEDAAGVATNNYYSWFDSRGVRRVKEDATFDSVGQAIEALYNPQFTKYTPGAVDYERVVLGQWNGNVAEIGTQAGGTGVLRNARLIGKSIQLPSGSSDPGCTTTADIGKFWFDTTTTTTARSTCSNVAGTLTWVSF